MVFHVVRWYEQQCISVNDDEEFIERPGSMITAAQLV
jgi:hypothetical protein